MSRPTDTQIERNTTMLGDVRAVLPTLPTGSVDTVVTSPPYFRLRDYATDTQMGLESTVEEWVRELRDISREIGRVIAPHGTYWLNLGDAYSTHSREGAPRKSLLGAPEHLLLALIDDGWIVRNKIVWAKPNPIPSSVTDRLACTYEVIYLLTRSPRYYFDLHAIREPHKSRPETKGSTSQRPGGRDDQTRPAWLGPNADGDQGLASLKRRGLAGHPWARIREMSGGWPPAVTKGPLRDLPRIAHRAHPTSRLSRETLRPVSSSLDTATSATGRLCNPSAYPTVLRLRRRVRAGASARSLLGAGTTALAAERQGKDWLGIELNPDYIRLADQRLTDERNTTPKGGDHE
ncbi:site-specific DNA-methyltransferase [Ornithinimicrobium sp. INDO-MA30-4]|uniref:DNA-methyltransferase n=1 Tax=Ornithinimicrobium sp. INDO-MA30-4 TaxID=2908651 RepID=UPI001F1E73B0|nr:site-specific DNA-methyltransferase [Ornithinimicrobium sp. INDO-MA30-4]UJH70453.1 site-specific DNA-methyltransferase [Ornithinimicrobium sp. INDO-MA30-4]